VIRLKNASSLAVDAFLQPLTWFERRHIRGSDLEGLTSSRITTSTGRPMAYHETAEPSNLDFATALELGGNDPV